jgi:hypothetical protein
MIGKVLYYKILFVICLSVINIIYDIIQPIDGITKIVIGNHESGEEIEELMNYFDLTEQYYSMLRSEMV